MAGDLVDGMVDDQWWHCKLLETGKIAGVSRYSKYDYREIGLLGRIAGVSCYWKYDYREIGLIPALADPRQVNEKMSIWQYLKILTMMQIIQLEETYPFDILWIQCTYLLN